MTHCLLCDGPCDANKWTCRNCHPRLIALATRVIVEEARRAVEEDRDEQWQKARDE